MAKVRTFVEDVTPVIEMPIDAPRFARKMSRGYGPLLDKVSAEFSAELSGFRFSVNRGLVIDLLLVDGATAEGLRARAMGLCADLVASGMAASTKLDRAMCASGEELEAYFAAQNASQSSQIEAAQAWHRMQLAELAAIHARPSQDQARPPALPR